MSGLEHLILDRTLASARENDIQVVRTPLILAALDLDAEQFCGHLPRNVHRLGVMFLQYRRAFGYYVKKEDYQNIQMTGPISLLAQTASGLLVIKTRTNVWIGVCGESLNLDPINAIVVPTRIASDACRCN